MEGSWRSLCRSMCTLDPFYSHGIGRNELGGCLGRWIGKGQVLMGHRGEVDGFCVISFGD